MGAPGNYVAQYNAAFPGGSFTTLANVQSIAFRGGRRNQLDAYNASSINIVARYPSGYASPITDLVPGTYMQVLCPNSGSYPYGIGGKIRNVNVTYGIPYRSSVGVADYVEIEIEGGFAEVGRMAGNGYVMASKSLGDQIDDMNTETGLLAGGGTNVIMAGTTVTGTWGDWLNSSLVTINGRMTDFGGVGAIYIRSPYVAGTCSVNFSDTTNNATNQVYDTLRFDALADNYYTQVQVDPESYSIQTVTKAGATKPYRTLTVNTFNSSAAQASDLATFLLSQYGTQQFAITEISCSAEAQNNFKLDKMGLSDTQEMIGSKVNVTFRGTTVTCVIEGVAFTATPEGARWTYSVSGADLNDYLVLNDSVFGKLDNNKLGY
jgi:hypothetical protein